MTRSGGVDVGAAIVAVAAALVLLVQGASAQGPAWSSFVTKAVFDQTFFNGHIAFYSYEAFKAAAVSRGLSAFGSSPNLDDRKRELAAFLTHVSHESGGLKEKYEQGAQGKTYCKDDTAEARKYPCAPGKAYIGRGPLQLTWNYNYGKCGEFLGLPFLKDPGLVLQNGQTAFKTAIWFWMIQAGPLGVTAHQAILKQSFSGTIQAINGYLECTGVGQTALGKQQMLSRVKLYKSFCQTLNVQPGTDLEC
ncbi:hypothetical protein M758_4G104400 [Ceratodon purpureus]|nr:hypothetical protein M758_4G104400 [Ceratodon purpureus]